MSTRYNVYMKRKTKRPLKTSKRSKKSKAKKDHVVVTTTSYGKALKGTKIYFEGKKPSGLRDDGQISFGKHILQKLGAQFPRFRWIITPTINSITLERGIHRIRTSQGLLRKMYGENIERSRDTKNSILNHHFAITYPDHFKGTGSSRYEPGTLSRILDPRMFSKLTADDKDALQKFLPGFIARESIGTVQALKATAQIGSLKDLASDLEREIAETHPESWWQTYIKANILLMQQGYIKPIDKMNVALGQTKFPDFALITHDYYLDILEIKRPDTGILKEDASRGNYYFEPEISKAISQTENYIEHINKGGDAIRSYLKDNLGIDAKALRPRGIILVGDSRQFENQKQRDDFRLLSQGQKNITILTYDELLNRVKNYIAVLEEFSKKPV
jgi:Shedu protein SduA, C-terminal